MRIRLVSVGTVLATLGVCACAHADVRNYDVGDRLMPRTISTTAGAEEMVIFQIPTVVVLWATWSPSSLEALRQISKAAPASGSRWRLLPINVDAPTLNAADTARINKAARDAGWRGLIWLDREYRFMDELGVLAVPTVIFAGLGGYVEDIEHHWSAELGQRLFSRYFGGAIDTTAAVAPPAVSPVCRTNSVNARREWRAGNRSQAIELLRLVVDSCPDQLIALGRYANWLSAAGAGRSRLFRLEEELATAAPNAWVKSLAAGLAMQRGDCASAVALAHKAVAFDSSFCPAWVLLSEAAWKCSDTAQAVAAHERARRLNRFDRRVLTMGAVLAESRNDIRTTVRLTRTAVEAGLGRRVP